jgi:hypothetical protein
MAPLHIGASSTPRRLPNNVCHWHASASVEVFSSRPLALTLPSPISMGEGESWP